MTRAKNGTDPRAKGNVTAGVPRLAWTVRELAAALRVNYQTALRMIHNKQVTAFTVGGEYRIGVFEIARLIGAPPAELEQFLADLQERAA